MTPPHVPSSAPPVAAPVPRRVSVLEDVVVIGATILGVGAAMVGLWSLAAALWPDARGLSRLAPILSTAAVVGLGVGLAALRQHRRQMGQLGAELALQRAAQAEQAALIEALLAHSTQGVALLGPDLRVERVNPRSAQVHGESTVGRRCAEALGGGQSERCASCPIAAGRDSAEPPDLSYTVAETGEALVVSCRRLISGTGRHRALIIEQVVTEGRKLQARLLHQEKMAAFGLLAAGIAHEMGNPLSAIGMHLQLLDDGRLDADAAHILQTARGEVERIGRTLREMIDFSRRRRDVRALVSVQSSVHDAIRLLRHDQRMRSVTVEVEADPEAPPVCMVEDHLVQVVLNLLINSLDAMTEGGHLTLDIRSVDELVVLRITDNGVGMERRVLDRCFEPLYTTKEPGKGTGLGLGICRDILADAGGEIEVHSARGRGTTVVVSLPAAQDDGATLPGPPGDPVPAFAGPEPGTGGAQ